MKNFLSSKKKKSLISAVAAGICFSGIFCLKMLRQSSSFISIGTAKSFSMSNITARAITPKQEQDFLSAKLQVSIMIYQANLKAA